MQKLKPIYKSEIFISCTLFVVIVATTILSGGQLGSKIDATLRHADIPPSNNCSTLVIPHGEALSTRDESTRFASSIAKSPANIDAFIDAMTDKFGDTLTSNEAAVVCPSTDNTMIATIDNVNIGR